MPVPVGSLFEGGSYSAAVKEAARQGIETGELSAEDNQAVFAASVCCWDLNAAQFYAARTGHNGAVTLVECLLQFNIKGAVDAFPSIAGCIGSARIQDAILGKSRAVLISMTPKGARPDLAGHAASIGVSLQQLEAASGPAQQSSAAGWGAKKISMVGQVASNAVASRMH